MPEPDLQASDRASRTASGNWLTRFFRNLVTEIRPGEGRVAMLLLSAVFFFLASLYMLKVAREAKVLRDQGIFGMSGPELKAMARGFQAMILALVVIPVYGWVSSRVPRRTLMIGMTLFYALNIEIFYLLSVSELPNVGFYFYVWVGIFNVSIMAQFWSYVNDVYDDEASRRIFPLIMMGASLGGVSGVLVDRFIGNFSFFASNPFAAMHVTAGLLLTGLLIFLVADYFIEKDNAIQEKDHAPLQLGNGLVRVLESPYLRLIGLLLMLLNLVNSTGEYILDNYIISHAADVASSQFEIGTDAWRDLNGQTIGRAFNTFYLAVNLLTLGLQMFVASRIIRRAGMVGALLILPVVALGAYGLALLGGGYLAFRVLKIIENAADYSINNTVQQLLWAPTSREEKYQAKQAADTIFYRMGDLLHSALIWVGTGVFALVPRDFAMINVLLCVVWVGLVFALGKEYRKVRASAGLVERTAVPL